MRPTTRLLLGLGIAALASVGCIQSVCTSDADCGLQVCDETTGECLDPECTQHAQCPEGEYCDDRFCEEGCVEDEDCGDDMRCYRNSCIPADPECETVTGLPWSAVDLNPHSASVGQEVSVPSPSGAAQFFGVMSCGSCRGLFGQIEELADEIELTGADPQLVFVQNPGVNTDEEYVGEKLEQDIDEPVLQDTEAVGVTEYYQAERYDLVLLDVMGCLAHHFAISSADWPSGQREEVEAAWIEALSLPE